MIRKVIDDLHFPQSLPRVGVEELVLCIVGEGPVDVPVFFTSTLAPASLLKAPSD